MDEEKKVSMDSFFNDYRETINSKTVDQNRELDYEELLIYCSELQIENKYLIEVIESLIKNEGLFDLNTVWGRAKKKLEEIKKKKNRG